MKIKKLVLIRHGESQWNLDNRFTGWCDIDLSKNGIKEAKKAGKLLKRKKIFFDIAYTSLLKRAIHTLWYILKELDQSWLEIKKSWKLNERHYGALQGANKDKIEEKYGKIQINKWRRGFHDMPPILKNQKNIKNNPQYLNINIPNSESLFLTLNRVIDYWEKNILKSLKKKKNILVVAHGNSLRALTKYLENLTEKEIYNVNIPTGIPIVYEFNRDIQIINKYSLL